MSLMGAKPREKQLCQQTEPMRLSRRSRLSEKEPLGFYGGDTNLYRFVGDDPTNATDPSGLKLVINGHEVQDASDQMYKDIMADVAKSELLKKELDAAGEMLDTMIKSSRAKKTYDYTSIKDAFKEIRFRIYIITAAKSLASDAEIGRLRFPDNNKVSSFPKSELFQEVKVKVPVNGEEREVTGIRLAKGTPAEAMKAIFETSKDKPLYADCSTSVILAIQRAYWLYLGEDEYNKLFDKDHPLILASLYGKDRLFVKQEEGVKTDLLPGDTQTFENRGAKVTAFTFENTIYLGEDNFFAPGIGILTETALIKTLRDGSVTRIVKPLQDYGKIKPPN